MAAGQKMIRDFAWDESLRISDVEGVLTPALIIYPDIVASNIACTLKLLGSADRWRAHIKTAKLGYTLGALVKNGVRSFKCATTLELLEACKHGAEDILVAFPVMGANARRVVAIASEFPRVKISALVENEQQVQQWQGTGVGVFIDVNPGMNRTGVAPASADRVLELVRKLRSAGIDFRGLHYYDGQYGSVDEPARTTAAHAGYDKLLQLISAMEAQGVRVPEVITAGTPSFPCSISYLRFQNAAFVHRVSPGTIVYGDATSLAALPKEYGYRPAALVVTRVVSNPSDRIFTCDAGHKTVSADAGVPTCAVVGHPEYAPLSPSEEHLPMQVESGKCPALGELLYLLPRHVCPTVNNFDSAILVRDGRIDGVERVSARGREFPLLSDLDRAETGAISQRNDRAV